MSDIWPDLHPQACHANAYYTESIGNLHTKEGTMFMNHPQVPTAVLIGPDEEEEEEEIRI